MDPLEVFWEELQLKFPWILSRKKYLGGFTKKAVFSSIFHSPEHSEIQVYWGKTKAKSVAILTD
jgi:hypothetical protein